MGVLAVKRDREEEVKFKVKTLKEYLDLRTKLEKYYNEVLSR